MRRSNADKRRAVLLLLQDEEWGKWNDSKIARACAVSHTFVASVRSAYHETLQDSVRLVERGGTTYPMKPRQRPAEPKPSEPVADEAQAELQEETPAAAEASANEPATGGEPSPELAPVNRNATRLAPYIVCEG